MTVVRRKSKNLVTGNAGIIPHKDPEPTKSAEVVSTERMAAALQTQREVFASKGLTMNIESLIETDFLFRRGLLDRLLDPKHDIDCECGYPPEITPTMYHVMFERDGLSRRVVELFPDESWSVDPELFDVAEKETDFDRAWTELLVRLNLWGVLYRADILSGIGRFGVLLLGLDDGVDYSEPVEGIDESGEMVEGGSEHKLLFVRAFDETMCKVNLRESDLTNPRFGKPTMYTLTFKDLDITEPAGQGTTTIGDVTKRVHWTRVIHLADNRMTSEVYGSPRMKPVFNRLMDVRKVLGGSAEMFWKGAFPGLSFELHPGLGDAELDQKSLRDEMERYSQGLQRYLAITGMTAKSLAPQIESPKEHLNEQLTNICITLGVPIRIFLGSEEAKLASSQDAKAWIRRMARRQDKYITPMVIRPLIDRLIALGIVPTPTEGYEIYWPNMGAVTDKERAEIGLLKAQALSQYIASGGDQVISIPDFIQIILGIDPDDLVDVLEGTAAAEAAEVVPTGAPSNGSRPPIGVGEKMVVRVGTLPAPTKERSGGPPLGDNSEEDPRLSAYKEGVQAGAAAAKLPTPVGNQKNVPDFHVHLPEMHTKVDVAAPNVTMEAPKPQDPPDLTPLADAMKVVGDSVAAAVSSAKEPPTVNVAAPVITIPPPTPPDLTPLADAVRSAGDNMAAAVAAKDTTFNVAAPNVTVEAPKPQDPPDLTPLVDAVKAAGDAVAAAVTEKETKVVVKLPEMKVTNEIEVKPADVILPPLGGLRVERDDLGRISGVDPK